MAILTDEQVARLQTHLVIPSAVGDILRYDLDIEDDMQYGLHEALCEIDPDSALLAIALSAKQLAMRFTADIPVAGSLSLEADKIIEEYGPEWLTNFNQGPIDEDALHGILQNVPEDLECLADLIDALGNGLIDQMRPEVILCDILSIQARAHMEIADYMLKEINGSNAEADEELIDMDAYRGDNIILFPAHLRN